MKELGKWQIISFVSRGMATFLGIVQSFVIVRILSVGDWGIIQLAASIGGALGIYQHLGLASASTREIASAKDDTDIFKIFLTSAVIRYIVTLPLSFALFFYADKLAVGLYKNALLILPLKIYGITLLFQGMQSLLNSVVMGTKRFKRLFTYQVLISVISAMCFIPLVYLYKINGYFWAYLLFNAINSLFLFFLAFGPLHGKLVFPSKKDFRKLFREIFSISLAIYFVKILATNWEKMGTNILGLYSKPEIIGIFAFAVLYSRKILSISDAVTDVTLPVFSEKYANDINDFKMSFKKNFDKVFGFIILASGLACFWAPQIIAILVGGTKYQGSYKYIPYILLAFVIYSIADIVKSSVYVPAKLISQMILSYVVLIGGTIVAFYIGNHFTDSLMSMSIALAFGSLVGMVYIIFSLSRALNYTFFDTNHWLILLQSTLIGWVGIQLGLMFKLLVFPFVALLMLFGILFSKILTVQDLLFWQKYGKKQNQ